MSATEAPTTISSITESFTCNACKSIFENGASQRMHFKTDLHVTNVKRRQFESESSSSTHQVVEGVQEQIPDATKTPRIGDSGIHLPTTKANTPKQKFNRSIVENDDISSDHRKLSDLPESNATQASSNLNNPASDDDLSPKTPLAFSPSICLFCPNYSPGLWSNLTHMETAHGLTIPESEHLIHQESFIHYLFTVIFEFNECIHCGIMKGSIKGVQQHMLTKGHAKISLEKGSDYRDFYDFEDEDEDDEDVGPVILEAAGSNTDRDNLLRSTENFVRLSSGRTLGHRSTARGGNSRQTSHQSQGHHSEKSSLPQPSANSSSDLTSSVPALPISHVGSQSDDVPEAPRSQQLTTRKKDEKSLAGVPESQRLALRATEKKMAKLEIRARNRYEAAVQRAADHRPDLRTRRVTRVPDSV